MHSTLERLRSEFVEMPGLRLTLPQVQRLCGVDALLCRAILEALVDVKFLAVDHEGRYVRFTGDPVVRARMLQAPLGAGRPAARAS